MRLQSFDRGMVWFGGLHSHVQSATLGMSRIGKSFHTGSGGRKTTNAPEWLEEHRIKWHAHLGKPSRWQGCQCSWTREKPSFFRPPSGWRHTDGGLKQQNPSFIGYVSADTIPEQGSAT